MEWGRLPRTSHKTQTTTGDHHQTRLQNKMTEKHILLYKITKSWQQAAQYTKNKTRQTIRYISGMPAPRKTQNKQEKKQTKDTHTKTQ